MPDNKHLNSEQRSQIAMMLKERLPFIKIAETLDKHPSTISYEVKLHSVTERTGNGRIGYNACIHRRECQIPRFRICTICHAGKKYKLCKHCGLCNTFCDQFEKQVCKKLQRAPYVCNGCLDRYNCTLEKKIYKPDIAQAAYKELLTEARTGISVSEEEIAGLEKVMAPLVRQKQSIHHICVHNRDEVMVSERSLYRMVDGGLFSFRNIDLPRKVRYKARKTKQEFKVDRACRTGRDWQAFLRRMEESPDTAVVQIDSVEGKKGSAVLLTVHFVKSEFMLAFYREHNDSRSVNDIFNSLYETLGAEGFKKIFPLILADNGSEFSNPSAIETTKEGEQRTQVFYCDPNAPQQKGSAERNHEFIRYFLPKGKDISIYGQAHISLMMDHINSYSRESLGDKCPYDVFGFLYGREILDKLGCRRIPPKEITLSCSVFKEVPHHDL